METSLYIKGIELPTSSFLNTNYLSKTNSTAYMPSAQYHPATKKYVDDCIAAINQLHFEIVEELPQVGESTIIYMILANDGEGEDYYDEYIYINNTWEKIGSTRIDLTPYATINYVDEEIDAVKDELPEFKYFVITDNNKNAYSTNILNDVDQTAILEAFNYWLDTGRQPIIYIYGCLTYSGNSYEPRYLRLAGALCYGDASYGYLTAYTIWDQDGSGNYGGTMKNGIDYSFTKHYSYEFRIQNGVVTSAQRNIKDAAEMKKTHWQDESTFPVMKSYVDSAVNSLENNKQDIIQYTQMPTPSNLYENKIIQYMGDTNQNYTQGYWYKCVNNQDVYSWENIDVQDVSEIELPPTIIINHDGGWSKSIPTSQFSKLATIANYYIKYNSILNAYYISDAGVYTPIVNITVSNSGDFKRFYCTTGPSPNASDWGTYYGVTYKGFCSYMAFSFYVTNVEYEAGNIINVYNTTNTSSISRISVDQSSSAILGLSGTNNIPLGTKNAASYTPTGDYNPATKKYVDDSIIAAEQYYDFNTNHAFGETTRSYYLNQTIEINSINTAITNAYANGDNFLKLKINWGIDAPSYDQATEYLIFSQTNLQEKPTWFGIHWFSINGYPRGFFISGSWTGDNFICDDSTRIENYTEPGYTVFSEGVLSQDVLLKNNTNIYTPSGDYNPATKKYVDDALGNVDLSKVAGFINLYNYSSSNPLVLSTLEPGLYILSGTGFSGASLTMVARPGNRSTTIFDFDLSKLAYLVIQEKIPEVYDRRRTAYVVMWGINQGYYTLADDGYSLTHQWSLSKEFLTTSANQTISGKKTFNILPESSVTPTTNNQLVNKKYVDDNIPPIGDYVWDLTSKGNIITMFSGGFAFTADDQIAISNIINDYYAKHNTVKGLSIQLKGDTNNVGVMTLTQNGGRGDSTGIVFVARYEIGEGLLYNNNYVLTGTWSNNVFSCTTTYFRPFPWNGYILLSYNNLLQTNKAATISNKFTYNTLPESSITPTTDNQFTTKKYVDDSISNKIWIGTQAEYDALGTYSDDTLYFIKETQQTSY